MQYQGDILLYEKADVEEHSIKAIRLADIRERLNTMHHNFNIPEPPVFTEKEIQKCRDSGDYRPVLFEWYKFVGEFCNFFSRISPDSEILSSIEPIHYGVLVGLLNRCSRLMFSNVVLSHQGLFGETTAIIDRCIFESSIKVKWLCQKNSNERFERFLVDGLKTEVRFKEIINNNIKLRGGDPIDIEERMLSSIDRCIASSGLTESRINVGKKLPDLFQMMGGEQNEPLYVIGQKIGSHHVHGTWPSLFLHYLESDKNGYFQPRDHNCETHTEQYVFIPLFVLQAIKSFVWFVVSELKDKQAFLSLLESIERNILIIIREAAGNDFKL